MKREPFASLLCAALLACGLSTTRADVVSHDIGDPEMNVWKPGDWVTCGGDVLTIDDRPAPATGAPQNAKTLRLEQRYGVRSFGGWNASLTPNTLPGRPVRLEGWMRLVNTNSWTGELEFHDANTNRFVAGFKPWDPDSKEKLHVGTEWTRVRFDFPTEIEKDRQKIPVKFPIKIGDWAWNNWGDRNNPNAVTRALDVYDLRLFTDMEGIAEADRPYSLNVTFPVVGNTFLYGEDKPVILVSASSWLGSEKTIRFQATVTSASGEKKTLSLPELKVLDGASVHADLPFSEPGAYTVEVTATGFPKEIKASHRYIVALKPRELTMDEKQASPYGINVHGGGYVGYEKFARLGFVWLRDYAFTYSWMLNARGDGKYAGWPWYPKICKAAEDVGMLTLPCLMGAVRVENGVKEPDHPSFTPNNKWRRDMSLIVASFDNLSAFELDNETDGSMWTSLDGYGRYCQAFGDIIHASRPDALAVSPGLAGIYVEQTQELVDKGYFRNIDVVNGHRYCGIDNPEQSKANLNTGMSEAKKTFLRDVWRHWKKAACADGKFRQLWLTEWGWDTRAGQIVTEVEQAAYMQRKWVLAMGNGVEKMFWYWYYDSDVEVPKNFFDGCGIFDRFREPKPVAAAFAALRTFLPAGMEYKGYANLDENHMAHILKVDGKLVALAFKINLTGTDLEITDPKAEGVFDMYGAKRKPGKHKLGIDPTWYVGLDPECDWVKQCPIDLDSDFFVRNVSGEPIKVLTTNNDTCAYEVIPPKGWAVEKKDYGFDITGPEGVARGADRFMVIGTNGKTKKVMPVEIDIVPQAYAKSSATDFKGDFSISVVNQSAFDQVFTVRGNLPAGWKIEPDQQDTAKLAPEEKATLQFHVVSTKAIPATEEVAIPKLEIVNSKGMVIDYAPIIPREWELHRVKPGSIAFDGKLNDWSPKYQLPRWMLGPNGDKELSRVFFGYADDGLYFAFEVDDSKCFTSDPASFWRAADCLELGFHPPRADFDNGQKWDRDDHQFWFCPLPDEKRVYAGFWGNCEGQSIDCDMKDVKTGLTKSARGYTMEVFIPKERLYGWNPKQGGVAGMMFTLAVEGLRDPHEVYWPASKKEMAIKKPWTWAKVKFGD